MPASMSTVEEALKEVYLDRIRDQLQSRIKTLARITRSDENIVHTSTGGKYVRFATRIRRNHGIGARLEREALPVGRQNRYMDAQVPLKYLYGSIDLTGQMFELATKEPQAFSNLVDEEVKGLTEGLKKDFNRQVYGTNTGIIAVAVTGTTTTLVNTNPGALQYVEVGMVVDVIDSNGSTVNTTAAHVQSVNLSTGTVTLSANEDGTGAITAVAVNDFLVRNGNLGREITGFSQFIDSTGSVYNIDASTTPVWSSAEIAVGGTLSEGVMIELADRIYVNGGDNISVGFCSLGVRRAYFQLLAQFRQTVNTTKYTGGFTGLAFTTDEGDIPIVHDVDCQPGTMYFVSEKELTLFEPQDWDWMDRDGSMWQRVITTSGNLDAYQATMFKYCELATTRRNAHGKLTGVTEPTPS